MSETLTPTFESTKLQHYVNSAGSTEQCAPVSSVKGCPNKNWAEVEYFHVSGKPVKSTPFYLTRPGSTDTLAEGVLDANGYAFVPNLPDGLTAFDLYYTTDPKDFTIFDDKKPKAHGIKPSNPEDEAFYEKALRYAKVGIVVGMQIQQNAGVWALEAIMGDFKEDRSMGQIAFDSVVSMIPVVDQVADVRDIAANSKTLIWDGKYKEFDPWFSLVTTIIGCIPEIGTAIKGSCRLAAKAGKKIGQKLMKTGIDVGILIRFLNTIGEGNAVKWIRHQAETMMKHADDILKKIYDIFDRMAAKINDLKAKLFNKADEYFQRLLNNLKEARGAAKDFVFEIFAFCQKEIKELIEKIENYFLKGKTRAKTSVQQRDLSAELAASKKRREELFQQRLAAKKAWIRTVAKEAGMDPKDVEDLLLYCFETDSRIIVRFTNPDGYKFQQATMEMKKKFKVDGFLPKPLDVKLKSAKPPSPNAGLVVKPDPTTRKTGKLDDWEEANIKDLESKGYYFDTETGILKNSEHQAFYGDYDLQAVQRKATDGDGKTIHMEELSNPEDSDVIQRINDRMRPEQKGMPQERNQIQHGAENDNHVKPNDKNEPVLDEHGHQQRATEDEIVKGKSVLGREHADDEKYVVFSADGEIDMLDSPYDLYKFYTNPSDAFPWRYLSKSAMEAKAAAEKALTK